VRGRGGGSWSSCGEEFAEDINGDVGLEAEVIGGEPEPGGVGEGAIGFDGADGIAGVACGAGVGGRVEGIVADVDAFGFEFLEDNGEVGEGGELDPDAGGIAVEGWGVDEAEGGDGDIGVEGMELFEFVADAGFAGGEGDFGLFAGAGEEVEGELGIVVGLGDGFEGEEGDGLFLQFVDGLAAGLAGGFEEGDDGAAEGVAGVEVIEEGVDEEGAGLGDDVDAGLDGAEFVAGSAEGGAGVVVEFTGEDEEGCVGVELGEVLRGLEGIVDGDDGEGIVDHVAVGGGDDFDLFFGGGEDGGGILFEGGGLKAGAWGGVGVAVAEFAAEEGVSADEEDGISQFESPAWGKGIWIDG
jgi:hypothetical protein